MFMLKEMEERKDRKKKKNIYINNIYPINM